MISPLAIFEAQQCARMRYLSRIADGGSESTKLSIKDAIDRIVKPALSRLLANRKIDLDAHVADVISAYRLEMEGRALQLETHEDTKMASEELEALLEGILRAAARIVLPDFQHATVTIPEKIALHLSDGIEIESGPDCLVEYEGGRCGLFWHTVGANMQPNLWILRHSIVPAVLAFSLDLVEVRYVRRGRRTQGRQDCSLIYIEQMVKKIGQKRAVPVHIPAWHKAGGVKDRIGRVAHEYLGKHFGMDWAPRDPTDPRFRQYKYTKNSMTLTQMISASELQSWKYQVSTQETQIRNCVKILDAHEGADHASHRAKLVEAFFPQFRHSCPYCDFRPACDQAITDLQGSGLFRRRG
jgi:hypothetical protein